MSAVRSIKNQYRGINAHLHSAWQSDNTWGGFHTIYLGYLLSALRGGLRSIGYTAEAEPSLQIRRIDSLAIQQRRADVMLYDLDPSRPFQSGTLPSPAKAVRTVADVLDENDLDEKQYQAVVVYKHQPDGSKRGEPVAWIELLSPTNKGESFDADTYKRKRRQVLDSGLVFVELDYLHETPPTFHTISPAHPYRIIVLDPRPSLDEGPAQIAEFNVDEPIPTISIPLNAGDELAFDFDIPYQRMFEASFFGDDVDYAQLPIHFERYTTADRQRIACRMVAVLKAVKANIDLEATAPIPLEMLTLEEALLQISQLT